MYVCMLCLCMYSTNSSALYIVYSCEQRLNSWMQSIQMSKESTIPLLLNKERMSTALLNIVSYADEMTAEAEFLDEIHTKVFRVFLLANQSPLQLCLKITNSSNSRNLLQFLQSSYCTL
jgi:hypothetical protein